MKKKILCIGLGNVGENFSTTRHNYGAMFVRWMQKNSTIFENSEWIESKNYSIATTKPIDSEKEYLISFVIGKTYMNESGILLRSITNYSYFDYQIIFYDDLQKNFGEFQMRMNVDRGARGHNGLRSIIEHAKKLEKFSSQLTIPLFFALGIGRPEENGYGSVPIDKYVLQSFSKSELERIPNLFLTFFSELEKNILQILK